MTDGNMELKAFTGGVVRTGSDFVVLADDGTDASISIRSLSADLTKVSDDLVTTVDGKITALQEKIDNGKSFTCV
jgi:hypothetical protein